MSFAYYTCATDFPRMLWKCHGLGIADIGGTTLNAIYAVQNGINPYTIDVQGDYNPNSVYRGYRYWPMMIAIYMPLASFFTTGWGAIRLTNFVLDVITAALIVILVCRRSGWLGGVLAASLYLMLPMLPDRLYAGADTDLAPTVLLLAALALYQTRPGLAGVMVGLSVSAKFLPGLLMLVCCLPEFRRSRYVGGFVLGLAPAVAFCLLAPSDFIDNTVAGLSHHTSRQQQLAVRRTGLHDPRHAVRIHSTDGRGVFRDYFAVARLVRAVCSLRNLCRRGAAGQSRP